MARGSIFLSFPGFSAYRLSKPNAGAPAVLVDEFDASVFEGPLHNIKCRTARLTRWQGIGNIGNDAVNYATSNTDGAVFENASSWRGGG